MRAVWIVGLACLAGCAAPPDAADADALVGPEPTEPPPLALADANTTSSSAGQALTAPAQVLLHDCRFMSWHIPVSSDSVRSAVPPGYDLVEVVEGVALLGVNAAHCGAGSLGNASYFPSADLVWAMVGLDSLDTADTNSTYAASLVVAAGPVALTAAITDFGLPAQPGTIQVEAEGGAWTTLTDDGQFSANRIHASSDRFQDDNGITLVHGSGRPLVWLAWSGTAGGNEAWMCTADGRWLEWMDAFGCTVYSAHAAEVTLVLRGIGDGGPA